MVSPSVKFFADPIHGAVNLADHELELVSTEFFQRLRWVKQLGVSFYIYPGAVHTRFPHSLGVPHVVSLLISGMKANVIKYNSLLQKGLGSDKFEILSSEAEKELRVAGLLHDIGHFPFSHVLESAIATQVNPTVWDGRHEKIGETIILETEIKDILLDHGFDPNRITNFITKKEILSFAHNQMVSSAIDADRLDYLLRDAYFSGAKYGMYDLARLTQVILPIKIPNTEQELIVIHEKGVPTIEQYLIGRFRMYNQVYMHKTVVFFEQVMRDLYRTVLETTDQIFKHPLTYLNNPYELLDFDDNYFITEVRKIANDEYKQELGDMNDGCVRLAKILTQRKVYKTVLAEVDYYEEKSVFSEHWNEFEEQIREEYEKNKLPYGSVIIPSPKKLLITPTPPLVIGTPPSEPENFFEWMKQANHDVTQQIVLITKKGKLKLATSENSPGLLLSLLSKVKERHYRVYVEPKHAEYVKHIIDKIFPGRRQLTLDETEKPET